MDKEFEISREFDGIHFEIQPNGKDEVVSRSSINVINQYREGFIVKKNNELLAICHESKELDIEFVKPIDREEFDSFNSFLKSKHIETYNLWDIQETFNNSGLYKVDAVHLMSNELVNIKRKSYENLIMHKVTYSKLKQIYSDTFDVVNPKRLESWLKELKNEDWFSLSDIHILGYETPAAFLIIRKRSKHILEVFLFGIIKQYRSKGLGNEFFSHLMDQIYNNFNSSDITIQIWVHESNNLAYSLYQKHNFKSIRIRKKYLITL